MKLKQMLGLVGKTLAIATISAAANAATMTYSGPGTSYADTAYPTDLTFSVSDTGLLSALSVYINLGAPYGDDVTLSLIHNGVTVKLYDGHGDNYYSSINATFTDTASSSAPYSGGANGTFLPVQNLSAFNGFDVSGNWTLRTQDFVVPGDGTPLQGWSITATTVTVPEPTTVALLGLGLLGVAASRRKSAKNKKA